MKTIKTILAALFLFILLFTVQAAETIYTLQVDGLACPFCAYGIEKQLSAIEGVATVSVDISKGQVFVIMQQDAKLDEKMAQQAVSDAGFSLRSFKQNSEDKSGVSGQ